MDGRWISELSNWTGKAYKNLVTLAEIILIGYNSNDKSGGKKEKFANRLAAAIAQDADVQSVHDNALRML